MKKILTVCALAGVTVIVTPPALAATSAGALPKGFLLYEKAAENRNAAPGWSVSQSKDAKFAVNPCQKASLAVAGRTAARTVSHIAVSDQRWEQVILYSTAKAARQALAAVRKALPVCPPFRTSQTAYKYSGAAVALGDEGLAVTGQLYQAGKAAVGGERAIVARRGNALVVYSRAAEWGAPDRGDFARQTKDARRMLAKICQVASCS
ncbi:hypothetical protein [Streptosporangium carneum]|uniref:Sensor domain-containing protein n=1 Tax=Streptosporangium carneum TaxID=47481 RepID=A0A9W6I4L1_9ACTN|nr:hypothetical protein [Streptosporangium carneum]GLK11316.1 hypothetical protein GCM10017600_47230 [Streptosporangium carneum]